MLSKYRFIGVLLACWLMLAGGMARAQFNPASPPATVKALYLADNIAQADSSQVTTWSDTSGQSHNLTGVGATIVYRTAANGIGGNPAVQFSSSTTGLRSGTWGTALLQTDTVFIVYKNAVATETNFLFDDVSEAGESTRQTVGTGNATKSITAYAGTSISSSGASNTSAHYAEVQFAGSSTYAKVDGTTLITGFTAGNNTLGSIALSNNTSAASWTGLVAFVVVCDSTATAQNLADIRTYINNKYFPAAPVYSSASVPTAGTSVSVTFTGGTAPLTFGGGATATGAGGFSALVGGVAVTPSSATVSGSVVTLNLPSTVYMGQTVTISYTAGGNGNLQDSAATPLIVSTFGPSAVTNNSTQTANATGYSQAGSPASPVTVGTPITITYALTGGTSLPSSLVLSPVSAGVAGTFASGTLTYSAGTVTIPNGTTTGTITFTPSASGTLTLSVTHTGGGFSGGDPSNLTYTVNTGPLVVQFDQSNLNGAASIYCTEGNWYYDPIGKSITATHFGSYIKLAFNVTSTSPTFQVNFPASGFTLGSGGSGGYIGYSINGASPVFAAITSSSVTITPTNTAAGVHTIWLWVASVNIGGNRFNLSSAADAIQITSIQAPSGSTLVNLGTSGGGVTDVNGHFLPLYAKRTWVDGDSTAEAYNSQLGATPNTNGILSWTIACGTALQSETSIIATSSSNFTVGNAGIPASLSATGGTFSLSTPSSLTYYFTGLSRLNGSNQYPNPPDYYICNSGRNQWTTTTLTVGGQQTAYGLPAGYVIGTPNSTFTGYLTNYATAVRALCGSTTKIFMVCPFQKIFTTSAETAQIQEWAQEFAAWTPIDANTYSVNNGVMYVDRVSGAGTNQETQDGIHLTPFEHQLEGAATAKVIQQKLAGTSVPARRFIH